MVQRQKPDMDCYVGEKYMDPVEHEDNWLCMEEDYGRYVLISHLLARITSNLSFATDDNFVRNGKDCIPFGPEPILALETPTRRTRVPRDGGRFLGIPALMCQKGREG